jgi:hypothetical protein
MGNKCNAATCVAGVTKPHLLVLIFAAPNDAQVGERVKKLDCSACNTIVGSRAWLQCVESEDHLGEVPGVLRGSSTGGEAPLGKSICMSLTLK